MNKLLLGIAIGVLLQAAADNYHVLFMPKTLVPKEVVEEIEPSSYEEGEPEDLGVDEVWLVLPKWRPA